MITIVVVLAFVGTALGVMAVLMLLTPAPNPHAVRAQRMLSVARSGEQVETRSARRRHRLHVWLQQVAELLGGMLPSRDAHSQSKRRQLLKQAGYRGQNAVLSFQGFRLLFAIALLGLFLAVAPSLKGWSDAQRLAVALALGTAGLFIPHLWLQQQVKWRQEEISRALPDALDLMVVCVEAGLGLDATIYRLAQEQQFTKQALSEEFQIVSQEVRAGRSRSEALMAMKDRVGTTEMASFILVLLQAERMGTGIGRALRIHADTVRTQRRQKAEERAGKIPVKMVFPLVLLIFPATLLVILGPSWIMIYKALAAMKR